MFLRKTVFLSGLVSILLSGCFSSPTNEIIVYDLSVKKLENVKYPIDIVYFVSEDPTRFKMVTKKGNRLYRDESNNWAQTPSNMLSRFMSYGLEGHGDAMPSVEVSGNIFAFERNADTKTVTIDVLYYMKFPKEEVKLRKRIKTEVKVKGMTPQDYADAMSEAAYQQMVQLYKTIEEKWKKTK